MFWFSVILGLILQVYKDNDCDTMQRLFFLLICILMLGKTSTIMAQTLNHSTSLKDSVIGTWEEEGRYLPTQLGCLVKGRSGKKQIALTFDDGPGVSMESLLDLLEEKNAPSTFFIQGNMVEYLGEALLVRADSFGHVIANHTYTHPHIPTQSTKMFKKKEFLKTQKIIKKAIHKTPALFRPSFGKLTYEQLEVVHQAGVYTIGWSMNPDDWDANKDAASMLKLMKEQLHPDGIVLLHVGGEDRIKTVEMLKEFIDYCHNDGYEFVTADKILNIPAYIE